MCGRYVSRETSRAPDCRARETTGAGPGVGVEQDECGATDTELNGDMTMTEVSSAQSNWGGHVRGR